MNKLTQLQAIIDSSEVQIRDHLLGAQADISSIKLQKIQAEIAADTEARNALMQISARIIFEAFALTKPNLEEKIRDIAEIAIETNNLAKTFQTRQQSDADAQILLAKASQKLTAAQQLAAKLTSLNNDRARIVAEAQKVGLLPAAKYNPKTGTFTITSPARNPPPTVATPAANAAPQQATTVTTTTTITQFDPVALGILYETYLEYSLSLTEIERLATPTRVNAFAKCMLEHRTQNAPRLNETWEFAARSAQILRAKNVVGSFWPPAKRQRELYGRRKEFEFQLTMKVIHDFRGTTVSALFPSSLREKGLTISELVLGIESAGLSDPAVCARAPKRNPAQQVETDDDE